ncbi:MAG: branched-chain amino acid ABC transporter permease [Candidatus Hydrogenedentes bacterium]|nr:branched-chain amino acid ABC transporter permease [Candidatus Hydrogenedentota bacterium]
MPGGIRRSLVLNAGWVLFAVALVIPLIDHALPRDYQIAGDMRRIFVFAILGLGLNVVTGYTGLLNLGVAAFMAIGAYSYAILTCDIYPFRFGFWTALLLTIGVGAIAGAVLGLPTIRLRGDYLAIVTLGFGEITQDSLKNLDTITRGTQGINPLPAPTVFGYALGTQSVLAWYYLLLALLAVVVLFSRNLEHSRVGRSWISIREDEIAATCMGINPVKVKLLAFAMGAAMAGMAGALWAAYLGSTGEPGNFDFQLSIIALCIVIIGGMGNISGVLLGAFVIMGFNSIVLAKLTTLLQQQGWMDTQNVLTVPGNWKYMIFGLALILAMRFKPEGLLPSRQLKAELHEAEEDERGRRTKKARTQ